MEEKRRPKRAKFRYLKPDGYQILAVNGAYGGMTPRGDLMCHFFYEYAPPPSEELLPITEEGKLGPKEEGVKEEVELVRELRVGIVLNPVQAESIANWILDKVGKAKSSER